MAAAGLTIEDLQTKRLYFVGLLGSGMLPLAELCLSLGLQVTGSDTNGASHPDFTVLPQDGSGPAKGDILIYSTAISSDNADRKCGGKLGLVELHRYELLMLLLKDCPQAIAVSGTHGKTSTTTMTAEILAESGKNPGYFAGGRSVYFQGGSHAPGDSPAAVGDAPFVYEADESDGSFLKSAAPYRIITNIDADHLENYGGSYDKLLAAFFTFGKSARVLIVCGDDPGVCKLLPKWRAEAVAVYTYGYDEGNDVVLTTSGGYDTEFAFTSGFALAEGELQVRLPMPAPHYHRNFAAALILALQFSIPAEKAGKAIAGYQGVARRLQYYGRYGTDKTFQFYDDYGHHPTELEAVIGSLKQAGEYVCVLFQPHRYTRTKALAAEFAVALQSANEVVLLPIYSAGEAPLEGVSHASIAGHWGEVPLKVADEEWTTTDWLNLLAELPDKATVLTLGAGDVYLTLKELPGNPFQL